MSSSTLSGISDQEETPWKMTFLEVASGFTEPVCLARENLYQLYTLSETCKSTLEKVIRAARLILGMVVCCVLTPFSAPVGMAIRGAVATCESKPFIHLKRAKEGKAFPQDKKLRVVSHNVCLMPGGYSITDGQVAPPSDPAKLQRNITKIREVEEKIYPEGPDVICLQEVPDIHDAAKLASKFPEYPYAVFAAGTQAIGPPSMLFVASKYEISNVKFIPFESAEKTGRAARARMGFLSISLKAARQEKPFAHGICTHLQPSEIPGQPTPAEKAARVAQVKKIAKYVEEQIPEDTNIFIAGDFNQTREELNPHNLKWRSDPAIVDQPTWQGDEWCSTKLIWKKPPSLPCVLDYTFIAGKASAISTKILDTDYYTDKFSHESASDHKLLASEITLG